MTAPTERSVSAALSRAGFRKATFDEDLSSGDVVTVRAGFSVHEAVNSVVVRYWSRDGRDARSKEDASASKLRAMEYALRGAFRVSGPAGGRIVVREAAAARKPNAGPQRSTPKRNGARRVPARVVEMMRNFRLDEAEARGVAARIAAQNKLPGATTRDAVEFLSGVDRAIRGHGVLLVMGNKFGKRHPSAVAAYVNTGDPYNLTVIYDLVAGRVKVTDLGSFIEQRGKSYDLRWDVAP